MHKRGYSVALGAAALLLLATGCGNSDKKASADTTPTAGATSTPTVTPTAPPTRKPAKKPGKKRGNKHVKPGGGVVRTKGPKAPETAQPGSPADPGSRAVPTTAKPRKGSVAVGGGLYVVPAKGWKIYSMPSVAGADGVCLAPAEKPAFLGCGGLVFFHGSTLPGDHGSPYAPNQAAGWYAATGSEACPIGSPTSNDVANPDLRLEKGLAVVGQGKAAFNRWYASCDDGSMFQPRAWYLASQKVLIEDYLNHAESVSILKSATFTG